MRIFFSILLIIVLSPLLANGQRSKPGVTILQPNPCIIPFPKPFMGPPRDVCVKPILTGKGQAAMSPYLRSIAYTKNLPTENPLNYPDPKLNVNIKLNKNFISDLDELKMALTMKNTTANSQTFLFDKHDSKSTFLFGAACVITNSRRQSITKFANRAMTDSARYYKNMKGYYYTLESTEWLLKQYSVSDLLVVDSAMCPHGQLPPDTYYLQLFFQDNASNVVTFSAH